MKMIELASKTLVRFFARNINKIISVRLVIFLLCFNLPSPVQAAMGDLDLSFGIGGKVITDFNNSLDEARDVLLQPDGKIIAVGNAAPLGGTIDFAVTRYKSDGNLDPTFGSGGKVTTDFYGQSDQAYAAAIQTDGKIIQAGYASDGSLGVDFGLVRYHPNGSLDTSFGTGGKVTTDFLDSYAVIYALAIQNDGKIVAAGSFTTQFDPNTFPPIREDFALARYNPDGSLDTDFGMGGKLTTDFFGFSDIAFDVAIQQDGKIVLAGRTDTQTAAIGDYALARYNPDGSLDASFGGDGKVNHDLAAGNNNDGARALVIQPDGKIIAAGMTLGSSTTTSNFSLARYNSDGSPDMSFGAGGAVNTDFFSHFDFASAVAVQADGKIVVGGTATRVDSTGEDFAIARYETNGYLDATFGVNGKVTTDFSISTASSDIGYALAIQSNGQIVVAGSTTTYPTETFYDFALARYNITDFDTCLQDDSSGDTLQINLTTGEYRFKRCSSGVVITGIGTIRRQGSVIFLQHTGTDRRVSATFDSSVNKASASIQIFSLRTTFTLTDRNTTNNSCSCP